MPSEWRETTLGELCEFRSGSVFPTEFQGETEGNLPFIKVSDMELPANRYRIEAANNWVSRERARLLKANIHPAGATAFAKIGVALTYNRRRLLVRDTVVDNNMMTAIPDPNWVASEFFYYLLTTLDFNDIVSGTALPYLTQRDLEGLPVSVPSIPVQQAIARILGALDDKIELNRKMNETLEQMARAIFKACFTYPYEGLPMLMAGKPPSSFPLPLGEGGRRSSEGHVGMIDSPIGPIPKGWRPGTIEDMAEVVGGSTPSTTNPTFWENGTHHWATPKDLATLDVPALLDTERSVTDAGLQQISSGLLPAGTVLLSSRAPIGYLAVAEVPVAINQGFIAMRPKGHVSNLFLLHWARFNHDEIVGRANGTTFLEISKSNFRPIPVVSPLPNVMIDFDSRLRPMYQRVVANARESRTLAAIRDTLLPKLMSGEIRTASDEVRSTNWERLAGEIQTTNDARRSTKREVRESNTGRSR